ncbi:hypothetical protein Daus18300_004856 [Diaporthe australafricana]|uniref:Nuclease PA3 n=1 Tax=Diaporthe australafricana TaxID=127596 RepID=A0ABR3X595_9PEZI
MASSILLTLAALQGVNAWGTLGHATIAYIAQNYVTDEVASWAQGVLADTSDSYLANIASWADSYRATTAGAWSAPLHFIDAEDNPPSSCNVDYDRDCGATGCSVSAIANYTQRVGDGRLSAANVAEALKFLVHFTGDITQPLHDEAYEKGANGVSVTYQGYSDNLHSDWDTYLPATLVGGSSLAYAKTWATNLTAEINSGEYKSQAASWTAGDSVSAAVDTAMTWATDANTYVCTVVMPDGAAALTAMGDLYPTYYDAVIPTIELQIAKGGYRLGNWLNLIYDASIKKRDLEAGGDFKRAEKKPLPDLMGRDLLPAPRPLSKAKLARAAFGYGCNHAH